MMTNLIEKIVEKEQRKWANVHIHSRW